MIWLLCLPSRVSELDLPHEARCLVCDLWEAEPLCWRSSRKVTGANRAGSLTVHECRESRDVALETGGPQDALKRARAPGRLRLCGQHGDASRVAGRTARHRAHELAPRGRHLVDYARPGRSPALLGVVGGQDAVGPAAIDHAGLSAVYHGDDPDQPHASYRWTQCQLVETMRARAEWLVVTGPPAVVHVADMRTAAGPFGLLVRTCNRSSSNSGRSDRLWGGSGKFVPFTRYFGVWKKHVFTCSAPW